MAKRHHGSSAVVGMSFLHYCLASIPPFRAYTNATTSYLQRLTAIFANYFWTTYSTLIRSYVALVTVFLIVLLSLVMPDFSQKLHRTNELKTMKKVLQVMSKEVGKAELACQTVADEVCCLHCSMHDGTTETVEQDLSICTNGCIRSTQSSPAPMQVEKKTGFLHQIIMPKRNISHKLQEVAIMSYIYTDSLDAVIKPLNDSNSVSN